MIPTVIQRFLVKRESRSVITYGSSKTRIAVSKRTSFLGWFQLLCLSDSNRMTHRDQDRIGFSRSVGNTLVHTCIANKRGPKNEIDATKSKGRGMSKNM
jgi:hypothetical protein